MAKNEQDREDLLREATALVERIELRCDGFAEPIVIGFRRGGECSIFIGADPVYQFNTKLELRRGYFRDRLIKAEKGTLVALDRQRTADEVQLVRSELTSEEIGEFLALFGTQAKELQHRIAANQVAIVGQVPPTADVLGRVTRWLNSLPSTIAVAVAPNAR